MTELNLYFTILCALVALFCVIGLWRFLAHNRAKKGENKFVNSVMADAIKQEATVDLKLLGEGVRSGLAATMIGRSKRGLVVEAGSLVGSEWKGRPVEAYFLVRHDEGPVFFVFESTILETFQEEGKTQMELLMPQRLRVEQKRHFVRAQPPSNDVVMLAAWPMEPGGHLPLTSGDMGKPALSAKAGQENPQIMVENISGSGMALCLKCGQNPFDCKKGRQIMCLLAFKPAPDAARPVVFWCSAEIMNVRENGNALSLGLEFTNWAVQEQGDSEIHWTHNSPWRGVKPILQWVQNIEKAKNPKGG